MDIVTIEQAQEEILRIDGELKTVTGERDTLLSENDSLKKQLEESRTLNQKLFLEVRQSKSEPEPKTDEIEIPTCEDLAKKLKF